jgi:hypothetical protein
VMLFVLLLHMFCTFTFMTHSFLYLLIGNLHSSLSLVC